MKMQEFIEEIQQEIKGEELTMAKGVVKERILEIQSMKRTLDKMEKRLEELLEKSPEEILHG